MRIPLRHIAYIGLAIVLLLSATTVKAQRIKVKRDSIQTEDAVRPEREMSLTGDTILVTADTLAVKQKKAKRDWETWRPSAKRALWLSIILPGAGQIYWV